MKGGTATEAGKTAGMASGRLNSWWLRLVFGRHPRRTVARIFVLAAASLFVFKVILLPVRVTGFSMEPSYRNGRVNLINRVAYKRAQPKRGDVVGIRLAGEHVMLLKRIVGLPGETIRIWLGRVYINGERLDEPYVKRFGWLSRDPEVMTQDEYFAIGDNRAISEGGRIYQTNIIGKAVF